MRRVLIRYKPRCLICKARYGLFIFHCVLIEGWCLCWVRHLSPTAVKSQLPSGASPGGWGAPAAWGSRDAGRGARCLRHEEPGTPAERGAGGLRGSGCVCVPLDGVL